MTQQDNQSLRDRATLTDEEIQATHPYVIRDFDADRRIADAARDHALRVVLEAVEPLVAQSEETGELLMQMSHHKLPSIQERREGHESAVKLRAALATFRAWQAEVQDGN